MSVQKDIELFKPKMATVGTWAGDKNVQRVTCPVCKEGFTMFHGNFSGVKLHVNRWAKKEAMAYALGELKKSEMNHFDMWKKHTRAISSVPKQREWIL